MLVQREMENWRSPLASIPPSSAGQLGEHRATQEATAELRRLKLQLVSRKKTTRWVVGAHTARVGGIKLARKENGDGPNAHAPSQATSVWPLSEIAVLVPRSVALVLIDRLTRDANRYTGGY